MHSSITMKYPSSWHGDMWREGAPCGNGRIGALVYGALRKDFILLNHTDLWRGGKTVPLPDVSACLPEIRRLLEEKRPDLADRVFRSALREKGYDGDTSVPSPVCDVILSNPTTRPFYEYRRTIRMDTAEVVITWREGEDRYLRRTFVSRADNRVYTEITGRDLQITVALDRHDPESMAEDPIFAEEIQGNEDAICYSAQVETSYAKAKGDYGAVCRIFTDGKRQRKGHGVEISGAGRILLVCDLFVGEQREKAFERILHQEVTADYEKALAFHAPLHRELFQRVNFEISDTNRCNEELLLEAFDQGASNELMEKMYAYGRYLFLCSTDETDTLPTHLVGLWNGTYQCFWAIFMYNVNFEMIYWQALNGNLPSFLKLALDYTERFLPDFRENARKMFGCRGIFINSVNTPESGLSKCPANHILNWTAGAGWFAQHFYDYYRFTLDETYLKEHAMPFLYETALFYEDFLQIGADGYYEFAPSTSPENVPSSTKRLFGSDAQTSKNATMDIAVVRELLTNLLEGSEITGLYAEKREKWQNMLTLLPPYCINPDGSLKEWADDFYEDNHQHRHHSHLYGVFPGYSVREGDEIYDAFVRAQDKRIAEGLPDQSSWSMVYMAGVNARMQRGDIAWQALSEMVRVCCMNNLFTVHNDWRRMGPVDCDDLRIAPFQIDANIGFPAVVNEMFLQRTGAEVSILPALPKAWEKGKIEGICAAGTIVASIQWEKTAAKVTLSARVPQKIVLRAGSGYRFETGEATISCEISAPTEFCLIRTE